MEILIWIDSKNLWKQFLLTEFFLKDNKTNESIDQLEVEVEKYGLEAQQIAVHMTGCPNGCARPYVPDIGLVGKAVGKYTVFLGGNSLGNRLAFIYDDLVPLEEVTSRLSPVLEFFKEERQPGEAFGDFCHRMGKETLQEKAGLAAK